MRHYSLLDHLITAVDSARQTQLPRETPTSRPIPTPEQPDQLSADDMSESAKLMRINHTGEVCAQALYFGQSVTADLANVREQMIEAAEEEIDHLGWCEKRLKHLNSRPSQLNPLFYLLSFSIGAIAGRLGDKWSLGFVAETEHQVCKHIEHHLDNLPAGDHSSRAVLQQMYDDEKQHEINARHAGGADLPPPIQTLMKGLAWVMKATTPYV